MKVITEKQFIRMESESDWDSFRLGMVAQRMKELGYDFKSYMPTGNEPIVTVNKTEPYLQFYASDLVKLLMGDKNDEES